MKKQTNRGEEKDTFFSRQENPTLLNVFHKKKVTENTELERQEEELSTHTERGSGWTIDRILVAYLDFSRYNPIGGGAYIPLPKWLQKRNAIILIAFHINCH